MIWQGRRRWILVSNLGAYFLSIAMLYQMSPFFQLYAHQTCGATEEDVGFIFAMLPFCSFLGALPITGMINRLGTRASLSIGLLLLSASSLGFGLSDSVHMWMAWRALQGVATAPIYTSIQTNLANNFSGPGEFVTVNGILEMCANLGCIVAPLLGGTIYEVGGFAAPFALSAGLHLLFLLLSLQVSSETAPGTDALLAQGQSDSRHDGDHAAHAGMVDVCYRRVCFMAFVAAVIPGVWGAIEPVLAGHLHSRLGKLPSSVSGLVILVAAKRGVS